MTSPTPDIGCGHCLGDTCCVLPWKHDGDHQPADTVLVDRRLRPLNRRYVMRVKGAGPADHRRDERELDFASVHQYKGREQVFLGQNFEDDDRGTEIRRINRPAVRVGDRWVRRCPDLEVIEPVSPSASEAVVSESAAVKTVSGGSGLARTRALADGCLGGRS